MTNEPVTVDDDALISTDVDKLIKTISSRKKIELGELEKETRIGKRNMERWMRVLEEEGYIKIEYRLTKAYVLWLGESVGGGPEIEEGPPAPVEEKIAEEKPAEELLEEPEEKEEEPAPFGETTPLSELELAAKKEEGVSKEHKAKKKVLEDLIDEGVFDEEAVDRVVAEKGAKKETKKPEVIRKGGKEEKLAEKETKEEEPDLVFQELIQEGPVTMPLSKQKPKKSLREKREIPLKEKVSAYLDEINSLRREMEALKKEKENLYRDRYLKLESKIEADIVSITERILEKEGKVLELKERLLELPDKVNDADKLQRTVEKIGKEGRNTLESAKRKVGDLIRETEKAEEGITEKISDIKTELDKSRRKMVELEESVMAINSHESKIKQMLSDYEKQATEFDAKVKTALSSLEETTEMKVEITEMTDQLRVSIERRERQLEELNKEFEEIKKVENWVKEYVSDYEKKIEEIESYVANSEEEMDKLHEAAEKEYINKYLKELENITKIYENELQDIASDEKNVENRIMEAKQRLSGLIDESQQMIRKLSSETGKLPQYDVVLRQRKERTSNIKNVVEEKEREKEKLMEDLDRAKRSKRKKK